MEVSFLVPVPWKTKHDVTPERRSQTWLACFPMERDYKVVVHIKPNYYMNLMKNPDLPLKLQYYRVLCGVAQW